MRIFLSILIGVIIGFFSVYLSKDGWNFQAVYNVIQEPLIIFTFFIIFFTIVKSLSLKNNLIRLSKLEVDGEEEDLVDDQLYEKSRQYSMYSGIGGILSLSSLAMVAILDFPTAYYVIAFLSIVLTMYLQYTLPKLFRTIYPTRPYPSINDKKYQEKILAMADEGERHIILVALYKSYHLIIMLTFLGIAVSLFYSVITNTSQLFSIIVLTIILLTSTISYATAIKREKK